MSTGEKERKVGIILLFCIKDVKGSALYHIFGIFVRSLGNFA